MFLKLNRFKIVFISTLLLISNSAFSSEKNITYMQILQKPNDLDLNLKYAQQQGKMGNFKQTISTLERLNMLYPDNTEIKLYLLSILVQVDSPEKANTIIEEMKLRKDLSSEDLVTLQEIEEELRDREPSLWKFTADISAGSVFAQNVNSVSKSRVKKESGSYVGFNSAKYDRTLSGGISLSATRPIGEESSFLLGLSQSTSEQYQETDDDFQSYGLTLALDTIFAGQSVSPYLMLSKSDYQTDADSFSMMYGAGSFFTIGERNTISYGYAFSDSKGNNNTSDTTANETNTIGHSYTLAHDFIVNQIISTNRFLKKNSLNEWSLWRKILTNLRHSLISTLLNVKQDSSGAYRCYDLKKINIKDILKAKNDSYSFFWESMFFLSKKYQVAEIPINLPGRSAGSSKMRLKDIIGAFFYLCKIYIKHRL